MLQTANDTVEHVKEIVHLIEGTQKSDEQDSQLTKEEDVSIEDIPEEVLKGFIKRLDSQDIPEELAHLVSEDAEKIVDLQTKLESRAPEKTASGKGEIHENGDSGIISSTHEDKSEIEPADALIEKTEAVAENDDGLLVAALIKRLSEVKPSSEATPFSPTMADGTVEAEALESETVSESSSTIEDIKLSSSGLPADSGTNMANIQMDTLNLQKANNEALVQNDQQGEIRASDDDASKTSVKKPSKGTLLARAVIGAAAGHYLTNTLLNTNRRPGFINSNPQFGTVQPQLQAYPVHQQYPVQQP